MLTNNYLLQYNGKEALAMLYNDVAKTDVHPMEIGDVEVLDVDGVRTKVAISFIKPLDPFFPQRREGSATFYYNRLSLSNYLSNEIKVGLRLPCTVHDVLYVLQDGKGELFDYDDFENFVITKEEPVAITAKDDSVRWVGSFMVTVVPTTDTNINIAEMIDDPYISIIKYMEGRTIISDMLTNPNLDFPHNL